MHGWHPAAARAVTNMLLLRQSAVECGCCPGRRTCLRHADALCECAPGKWRLAFRHSLGELGALLARVRARVPEGAMAVL